MGQLERYIYLIKSSDTGAHKIGISNDPDNRAAQLTYTLKEQLEVVFSLCTMFARDIEEKLHERYDHLRISNYSPTSKTEWFNLSSSELKELPKIAQQIHEELDSRLWAYIEDDRRRKAYEAQRKQTPLHIASILIQHGYTVKTNETSAAVSVDLIQINGGPQYRIVPIID